MSKILEILKKGLKKKILDELNFMIRHDCLFLNKNIHLIFINEKINFFALSTQITFTQSGPHPCKKVPKFPRQCLANSFTERDSSTNYSNRSIFVGEYQHERSNFDGSLHSWIANSFCSEFSPTTTNAERQTALRFVIQVIIIVSHASTNLLHIIPNGCDKINLSRIHAS